MDISLELSLRTYHSSVSFLLSQELIETYIVA